MLRFVSNKQILDLRKLDGFSAEVKEMLKTHTEMSEERANKIAQTVDQKIEYLRIFQKGKKIWKKEKYW